MIFSSALLCGTNIFMIHEWSLEICLFWSWLLLRSCKRRSSQYKMLEICCRIIVAPRISFHSTLWPTEDQSMLQKYDADLDVICYGIIGLLNICLWLFVSHVIQVNIPRTKKTYCKNKECWKHTLHKVTQYKKGDDSLSAQGDSATFLNLVCYFVVRGKLIIVHFH